METVASLIGRQPLFSSLNGDQLAALASATRDKFLAKGDILFCRGEPAKGLFVVVKGQIKLALPSEHGDEKVVEIVGPGQCFGEAEIFLSRPYPVLAESLTDTRLVHIASEAIFRLLETNANFSCALLAGMSIRLHALVRDVESYSRQSATLRVIGYLLQHGLAGQAIHGRIEVDLPASKHVIASRISLSPETLSRVFRKLSEAGLIRIHGRKIEIPDIDCLRDHAH
jgi:CRP-like cAMP-binding protein